MPALKPSTHAYLALSGNQRAKANDDADPTDGKPQDGQCDVDRERVIGRLSVSLLPLTLTLEDYAATEKIAYLPRKLSTEGVPPGFDPSVGDVTYYAPWGNLAIFHKDAPYAKGLVQLGRIDSGLEVLSVPGPVRVTIEAVDRR